MTCVRSLASVRETVSYQILGYLGSVRVSRFVVSPQLGVCFDGFYDARTHHRIYSAECIIESVNYAENDNCMELIGMNENSSPMHCLWLRQERHLKMAAVQS